MGLDILGGQDGVGGLTLRNVCHQAGLSQRYFYESFAEKDEFAAEVYDWAVEGMVSSARRAVEAAPRDEKLRAGISRIVRAIEADVRLGRLLFSAANRSNPVLLNKRHQSIQLFVDLLAKYICEVTPDDVHSSVPFVAELMVGGLGRILDSWINRSISCDADTLVDDVVQFLTVYCRSMSNLRGHPAQ
ncbi:TetR/AcrR family transcriptional regulator [Nocardia takedensis]|uniref:TetR/AcrR family transcriptional regulator n=1 Tax=Nocardia takedensis TaxID=259390 RepID=UPI0012F6280A|nr:TetR/AcrR family transcriptional regulator [Nocardia takedensis]